MKYIVDTNVLLNNPNILKEIECVITVPVLRELEKHKRNPDLAYKVRVASKHIKQYCKSYEEFYPSNYNYADEALLQIANHNGYGVVTEDLLLELACNAQGIVVYIPVINHENQLGYKEVTMTDEELAEFYCNKENKWELKNNEYLIIRNDKGEALDKLKYCNDTFKALDYKPVDNKYMGKVKPINIHQELLFDMLQDKTSKIKVCTGKFGTGKDYIMLAHAIGLFEKGKYDKLIYVRNTIEVKNSKPVGFLPGTINDKLMPFAQIIADHVGGQMGLELLINNNKIELQHLGHIRGRNIKNSTR